MFWDKTYTISQNIEALLQKEDVTLEELLDDEDILHECKMQQRTLVQYLTRPDIIKRLVELIITEPPEDLSVAQRFKHSNTACEILTFGLPSLDEKLVEEPTILQTLYSFLKQEPPLNPLLASFFSKTFIMLILKKSEQDWFLYQKMCLQVLEFIKSQNDFLDLIFKHFAIPVIMELLLQIIKEVKGDTLQKNLYDWLTEQKFVERLIKMLGEQNEVEKHNNISDFLCELIRHGRSLRQTEELYPCGPVLAGSGPLLSLLESKETIELLLNVILTQPPQESSITAGIAVILTLVDETIVEEPASEQALQMIIDLEKENQEKIVCTIIQAISPKLKDFHELLINPPAKDDVITTVGHLSPPFGNTRLQTSRLFTVLLRTGNMDVINAICETNFFSTLLNLFKQYMWNNFLHSEVEKCLKHVFTNFDQNDNEKSFDINPSALQSHVIVNCKIIPKLIDCWMYNNEVQSTTNGRRLGYMGHLIKIFENISLCISKSNHVGALIVSNLTEKETEDWKRIMDPSEEGELTKELQAQKMFLANVDPSKTANVFLGSMSSKDFDQSENSIGHYFDYDASDLSENMNEAYSPQFEPALAKASKLFKRKNPTPCFLLPSEEMTKELMRTIEQVTAALEIDIEETDLNSVLKDDNSVFNVSSSPWGADAFSCNDTSSGWADFSSDNFADFDAHFNSFANDLGSNLETTNQSFNTNFSNEKSDNNANIKSLFDENTTPIDKEEVHFKNVKNLHNDSEGFGDDNFYGEQSGESNTITDTKCISIIGDNNIGEELRQESLQNTLKLDCFDDRVIVTNGPNNEVPSGDKTTKNQNTIETSKEVPPYVESETKVDNRNEITDSDMENVAASILSTSTDAIEETSDVLENGPV